MHRSIRIAAFAIAGVVSMPASAIELVSMLPGGKPTDMAYAPAISQTGRYIVFLAQPEPRSSTMRCWASWYLRDLQSGTTELISRDTSGLPARCDLSNSSLAERADVSADGRYVVFDFAGADLVRGDPRTIFRTYLRDRITGVTRIVGDADAASGSPSMDHQARFVVVETISYSLIRHDLATGESIEIRPPGLTVSSHAISGDGNRIAYVASAPEDSFAPVVEVRDFTTGVVHRVLSPAGKPPDGLVRRPTLNRDGSLVVFEAAAENLTGTPWPQIVRHDVDTNTTSIVSTDATGMPAVGFYLDHATVSDDGERVAFRSAAWNLPRYGEFPWPKFPQLYVRHQTEVPTVVSLNGEGNFADLGVSDDVCEGGATVGCGGTFTRIATISGDGSTVVFHSFSSNLRPFAGSRQFIAVYAVPLDKLLDKPLGANDGIDALIRR